MPFIKKLVLRGFKSFAKRTEVPFEHSYSCVLGANGSGKSNIVDAICFVLGTTSAKTLRAEKSANLIFNGAKSGSPMKEAEVSIVFDNESKIFPVSAPDVMITRIVKNSGNSVYKINNEVMTRQQVVDTLAHAKIDPDGHNIILQGDIHQFTIMKPVERRLIVEDIAGIGIYEEKKQKAMLELEKVQAKLNEADIILTERQKTLAELKKDRDQAVEFKGKEDMLKRSKATRLSLMIKEKNDKKADVEGRLNDIKGQVEKLKKEIEEMKKEREEKLAEIKSIETDMDSKGDAKQKEIGKEIEQLKEGIIKAESREQVVEAELKKIIERKKQIAREHGEVLGKICAANKEKEKFANANRLLAEKESKAAEKINAWKQKHGISGTEEINARITELDRLIEEKQKLLLELNGKKQEFLRKTDAANIELKQIEGQQEKLREQKLQNREKFERLKNAKKDFAEAVRKLAGAKNESSVFASQLADARKEQGEASENAARMRIRSAGVSELVAGDLALAKIKSSDIPGVYGCVSELGHVDSKYSMALDVAAGQKLKNVVVSTDTVAAKCIQMLKDSRAGIVTFLPLNKLKERTIEQEALALKGQPGVHGIAMDFVSHDPKFRGVFKYVFGGTLVIDSIEDARRLGIGRARMVTVDGDLMEPSGAMIGGYRKKSGIGFQEKDANEGLKKAEAILSEITGRVNYLDSKKTENERLVEDLLEKKGTLEAEISGLEATLGTTLSDFSGENEEEIRKRIEEAQKCIRSIEAEAKAADEDKGKAAKERQMLQQKMAEASSANISAELEKMEKEKAEIREEIIRNGAAIRGTETTVGMHNAEIEKIKAIIGGNERDFASFTQEKETLEKMLSESKAKLKEMTQQQKAFYTEYEGLFKRKDRLKTAIGGFDTKLLLKEERIRHVEEGGNEHSVRIAEILGEIAGLEKEFEEFKEVQLRRGISLEDLNGEIKAIEREMQGMGNINMRALEVYEKADAECKELLQKYETLKGEKEQVLQMMFEIDGRKKEYFMKTFNHLLKNFVTIFSTLSTKGDANLVLENEENPFEGGLRIEVRLGGNKFLDILSLSGGEKTLAALAFIFAIQEFDPAPFYLLDEVDAALDKRNSELLSTLIAKYSSRAQYIAISHNDTIISEANAIYGVSMQDGISKIVSLKL